MNQPITVISDKATHLYSGDGVVVVIDGTVHVSQGARAVAVGPKALVHILGAATVSAYDGARVISHTSEGVSDIHDTSTLVAHAGVAYLYDETRVEVPAEVSEATAPLLHLFGLSVATIAAPAAVLLHDLSTARVEYQGPEVVVTKRSEAATVERADGDVQPDSGRHAAADPNVTEPALPPIPSPLTGASFGIPTGQQSVAEELPADDLSLAGDGRVQSTPAAAVADLDPATGDTQETSVAASAADHSPYGDASDWAPGAWVGITDPSGPVVRYLDVDAVEGDAIREFEGIADTEGDSAATRGGRGDVGVVEELPDLSKLPAARLVPPGM